MLTTEQRDAPETWTVQRPTGFMALEGSGAFVEVGSRIVCDTLDELLGRGACENGHAAARPRMCCPRDSAAWVVRRGNGSTAFVAELAAGVCVRRSDEERRSWRCAVSATGGPRVVLLRGSSTMAPPGLSRVMLVGFIKAAGRRTAISPSLVEDANTSARWHAGCGPHGGRHSRTNPPPGCSHHPQHRRVAETSKTISMTSRLRALAVPIPDGLARRSSALIARIRATTTLPSWRRGVPPRHIKNFPAAPPTDVPTTGVRHGGTMTVMCRDDAWGRTVGHQRLAPPAPDVGHTEPAYARQPGPPLSQFLQGLRRRRANELSRPFASKSRAERRGGSSASHGTRAEQHAHERGWCAPAARRRRCGQPSGNPARKRLP
jgi:hypothetical protein